MEYKVKRTKYTRFNTPGDAHFLSFRCYRNRKFLNYGLTRRFFISALKNARRRHCFDIWAYVIMPQHVHLLIFPRPEVYSISAILKSIKQPVARKSVNWLKANKPHILGSLEVAPGSGKYRFWQDGGGYDRNLTRIFEIQEITEYIHYNPVKAGLANRPEDWYWSSARAWVLDEFEPLDIDKESYPLF